MNINDLEVLLTRKFSGIPVADLNNIAARATQTGVIDSGLQYGESTADVIETFALALRGKDDAETIGIVADLVNIAATYDQPDYQV